MLGPDRERVTKVSSEKRAVVDVALRGDSGLIGEQVESRARALQRLRLADIVFKWLTRFSAIAVLLLLGGVIIALIEGSMMALKTFGFGFLEAGTVTPRPQPGNPKPRMWRLPEAQALINRLGFNNDGADRFLANLASSSYRGILGINIGRNFDTPNERAADDYVTCLRAVYSKADYVTVNISSPNTKGLRDLQAGDALAALLSVLKREQRTLAQKHGRHVPLAVKIAPDLTDAAVRAIARLLVAHAMDAVIATNTTLSRDAVGGMPHANEAGGLSGAPVFERSTEVVRVLAKALDGALPIIGVGGIDSGERAAAKIEAGASLVQVYTGLIYRGPRLIAECVRATSTVTRSRRT